MWSDTINERCVIRVAPILASNWSFAKNPVIKKVLEIRRTEVESGNSML